MAASGESERPAPAVGQRWQPGKTPDVGTCTIVEAYEGMPAGYLHIKWPSGLTGIWEVGSILANWRYLGWADGYGPQPPAVPQEGPGVRAGQRRRGRIEGIHERADVDYAVAAVKADGVVFVQCLCDRHRAFGAAFTTKYLGALVSDTPAPSVTPVAPTAARDTEWCPTDACPEALAGPGLPDAYGRVGNRTALQGVVARRTEPAQKQEPWRPSIDEDHWIPGVGERGWR